MIPQAPPELDLTSQAVPPQVGAFRRALRRWLGEVIDAVGPSPGDAPAGADDPEATRRAEDLEDLADDLVLATSEALENVVDHAYAGAGEPGDMRLHAWVEDDAVVVVVTDHGHWRDPPSGPTSRGRGLEMMERLAETRVDRGEPGTVVRLSRGMPQDARDRSSAQA